MRLYGRLAVNRMRRWQRFVRDWEAGADCVSACPQLANFILSIVFCYSYIQLGIDFSGIVIVVQLTLVALTFVFGFGLWITCKRKFILLKLYTVVLFAFVVLQMIALVAVAIGAGNSEEYAHPHFRPSA